MNSKDGHSKDGHVGIEIKSLCKSLLDWKSPSSLHTCVAERNYLGILPHSVPPLEDTDKTIRSILIFTQLRQGYETWPAPHQASWRDHGSSLWSVYAAELMAIFYAISLALRVTWKRQSHLDRVEHPATILSDSMSALQAIRSPSNKSGQRIIRAILQAASEMKREEFQFASNGCQDIATIPETTRLTGWRRMR
ncbi:unnamed protein product [Aspergillus oryzae]|nr:unnamed protein product [Aspergillus oryzae]